MVIAKLKKNNCRNCEIFVMGKNHSGFCCELPGSIMHLFVAKIYEKICVEIIYGNFLDDLVHYDAQCTLADEKSKSRKPVVYKVMYTV